MKKKDFGVWVIAAASFCLSGQAAPRGDRNFLSTKEAEPKEAVEEAVQPEKERKEVVVLRQGKSAARRVVEGDDLTTAENEKVGPRKSAAQLAMEKELEFQ